MIHRPVVAHLRLPPPKGTFSRQYKWALNQCAQLVAISNATANAYRKAGITAPIEVVYNGTNLTHFVPPPHPTLATTQIRVLYLGRVLPDKGLHVLVQACELAAASHPLNLTVVGNPFPCTEDRAYYARLRDQAESGSTNARFLDHVEDVRPLLAAADLLVIPSIWPEPFGRVIIEAMACGIPVIASKVGGIPEILAPSFADHLVPPNDPAELARAILRIGTWRSTYPGLGTKMRNHTKELFNADQTHSNVFQILRTTALPPH